MCDLYVLYIPESNIKEITMLRGKVFYSQHKLFTFRLLDAVTVMCRPRTIEYRHMTSMATFPCT